MLAYYLRLALRSFSRNRMLTALMVLAIAVGIGASMTTLTVMLELSGDPLPGKSDHIFYPQLDPETAADVRKDPPDMLDYTSAHDLWAAGKAKRQAMYADGWIKVRPTQAGHSPFMADMLGTTSDFFSMFNVPFRYGGPWTPQDEARAAGQVVISARINQRLFGGANSVGRDVVLNGHTLRVVGVLDDWRPLLRYFAVTGGRYSGGDTSGFYDRPPGVYLPLPTALAADAGNIGWFTCWTAPAKATDMRHWPCEWVGLWVQLDTPSEVAAYRRFLDNYDAEQRSLGRLTHPANTRMMSLRQWLVYEQVVPSDVKLQLWFAFGFLAVCLFNMVGLLLAKFLRRSGEIGVRRALGASSRSIFLQYLVEAGTVGLAGGLLGLLFTAAGIWAVHQQPVAYASVVTLPVPMLVLTLAVSVLTSLLAGTLPAVRASRVPPALQLKAQ